MSRHTVIAIGVAVAAGAYWSFCGLLLHWSFHSNGWDLGIFSQVVWNTAHGHWFDYTFRNMSYLGDHWQPVLLVLAPLAWLPGGAAPLLVFQGAVLGAAVVPLEGAARRLAGGPAAVAVVVAYVFGLGVARAVDYDFHLESVFPLCASTALWGLAKGSRAAFWVGTLALLPLKEDAALVSLALCWIAWLAFGRQRDAAWIGAIALSYAVVVSLLLMPYYRGSESNPLSERYGYLGNSAPAVVLGIFEHAGRVIDQLAGRDTFEAVVVLLLSAALLPLTAPRLWPPLAVVTLLPLLSKQVPQARLELHYMVVPWLVALVIAVLVLRNLQAGQRTLGLPWGSVPWGHFAAGGLATAVVALFLAVSPLPPSRDARLDRFRVSHHASVARSFVREIPGGAVVSAQAPLVPHLAQRRVIYEFPRVQDAKLVLLDRKGHGFDGAWGFGVCREALPALGFDLVRAEDGLELWEKLRPATAVAGVPERCAAQFP